MVLGQPTKLPHLRHHWMLPSQVYNIQSQRSMLSDSTAATEEGDAEIEVVEEEATKTKIVVKLQVANATRVQSILICHQEIGAGARTISNSEKVLFSVQSRQPVHGKIYTL